MFTNYFHRISMENLLDEKQKFKTIFLFLRVFFTSVTSVFLTSLLEYNKYLVPAAILGILWEFTQIFNHILADTIAPGVFGRNFKPTASHHFPQKGVSRDICSKYPASDRTPMSRNVPLLRLFIFLRIL